MPYAHVGRHHRQPILSASQSSYEYRIKVLQYITLCAAPHLQAPHSSLSGDQTPLCTLVHILPLGEVLVQGRTIVRYLDLIFSHMWGQVEIFSFPLCTLFSYSSFHQTRVAPFSLVVMNFTLLSSDRSFHSKSAQCYLTNRGKCQRQNSP